MEKKGLLMYTMHNPLPSGGGISRMAYCIGNLLSGYGYKVYYLSYKQIDSDFKVENQDFFPNSDPSSEANVAFLKEYLIDHNIGFIINHLSTNRYYSRVLLENRFCGVRVYSLIHNCVLNHIKNYAYQKEYSLRKSKREWLFHCLKQTLVKSLIVRLCILKYRNYYQYLEHKSTNIVLVSNSNILEMSKMIGYSSNKIIAVPNFIDLQVSSSFISKNKLIIWCGRVETHLKRVDMMLDIWANICHFHRDWKLVIMGEGDIDEMKRYAVDKNIINCNFVGRVNTYNYYKEASIICHTSISESFGLVLVEAMSQGVVPIAFDSFPSCKDIISDQCGIRVNPFSVKEYVVQLNTLIEDTQLRNNMACQAIEHSKIFSKDKAIKNWLKLLDANG